VGTGRIARSGRGQPVEPAVRRQVEPLEVVGLIFGGGRRRCVVFGWRVPHVPSSPQGDDSGTAPDGRLEAVARRGSTIQPAGRSGAVVVPVVEGLPDATPAAPVGVDPRLAG
jgi:hypothetical protein